MDVGANSPCPGARLKPIAGKSWALQEKHKWGGGGVAGEIQIQKDLQGIPLLPFLSWWEISKLLNLSECQCQIG